MGGPREKGGFVYMMTNWTGDVLYTGVTNNLERRVYEHKNKLLRGFTSRYNVTKLVCFEAFGDIRLAIAREKEIKNWRREKKDRLVKIENPTWKDLSDGWFEDSSSRLHGCSE